MFVRELTRLLLARGDAAGPLPESVRQTLTERLARVSPACAEMLEVAAVDGLQLHLDVVSRALDLTSDSAAAPDAGRLRDFILESREELARAAGLRRPSPRKRPAARRP